MKMFRKWHSSLANLIVFFHALKTDSQRLVLIDLYSEYVCIVSPIVEDKLPSHFLECCYFWTYVCKCYIQDDLRDRERARERERERERERGEREREKRVYCQLNELDCKHTRCKILNTR